MKAKTLFRTLTRLLLVAAPLLGAGCATKHKVKISSIDRSATASRPIASYRIGTRTQVSAQDTLRFKEAAEHIKTALSARGLYEAPRPEAADLLVEIDYGMTEPRVKIEEVQVPVFGRGPVAPDRRGDGPIVAEKELVGYQEMAHATVVREKHLSICGRENAAPQQGRPPEELWRVDVSIENESQDLRGYLPILASAAMDQIGTTTDGAVTKIVRADGAEVEFVKRGM